MYHNILLQYCQMLTLEIPLKTRGKSLELEFNYSTYYKTENSLFEILLGYLLGVNSRFSQRGGWDLWWKGMDSRLRHLVAKNELYENPRKAMQYNRMYINHCDNLSECDYTFIFWFWRVAKSYRKRNMR